MLSARRRMVLVCALLVIKRRIKNLVARSADLLPYRLFAYYNELVVGAQGKAM